MINACWIYLPKILIIVVTQDLFPPGKFAKTINRNAQQQQRQQQQPLYFLH